MFFFNHVNKKIFLYSRIVFEQTLELTANNPKLLANNLKLFTSKVQNPN